MCSRLLGLVREQVFAGMFGAGYAYDAFVVAFRIPNLLRDLFGEGALSAAFVTVFSDYDTNRSREETLRLASNVLCFFGVALSLISLAGIYLAWPIVNLLAPDFSLIPGKTDLTVQLTRIMLPFLVFISLAAVVMGMLNTRGRFFIPSLASSFFNLGSIIGGVSLALILPEYGQPAIVGMAVGTLIGGILQLSMQLPALRRTGFRFTPQLNVKDPGLHRILRLMVPATIGLSAVQINIFINTNFAASCAEGSVSWLNYAFRLVQLPIGIFGVALSIAMMPLLASPAAVPGHGPGPDHTGHCRAHHVVGADHPAHLRERGLYAAGYPCHRLDAVAVCGRSLRLFRQQGSGSRLLRAGQDQVSRHGELSCRRH